MPRGQLNVCIIGAGPRGISVLERICANARAASPDLSVVVHVVDPKPAGPGRVWRTNQSRHLLMNTVASQVTLFTDDSVRINGPVVRGPSLYEWATFLTLMGSSENYAEDVRTEAARLGPDSYPTRSFYGHYLEWVVRRIVGTAPDQVEIRVHQSRAISLDDQEAKPDGPQVVGLADGSLLENLDAVVLAQGHLDAELAGAESDLAVSAASRGLTYIPPSNPADVNLSGLQPGESIVLRGLGLNFFDYMALLTLGRGGRFDRQDGRLVYRPSGQEPRLYAASRRGVPHHARGENEKGATGRHVPVLLNQSVIHQLRYRSRRQGGLTFRRDLWPLIAREVEYVYYATLLSGRECDCTVEQFRDRVLDLSVRAPLPSSVLAEYDIRPAERWDWDLIARPLAGQTFADHAEYRAWLLAYLERDVKLARDGNVSGPVKAALDVLRDLRNEVRLVVDHGGLTGRSYSSDLEQWYTPLNAFLSIGPPVGRIEEMIALIEAEVLTLVGPDIRVSVDPGRRCFVADAPGVPGSSVHAAALIEARLPAPDLLRTADPLLRHLLATGQCRAYSFIDPDGGSYRTGGLDVTDRPYRLIDAAGRAHPRRFAYGVPTEAVHWVTAAGIRPGVDSVTLGDSDAIARTTLSLAPVRGIPVSAHHAA